MSRRTERLAATLQTEIADIIRREVTDPRVSFFPSITRVEVSDDLDFADVYITTLGAAGQQSATLHALQHAAGMIRTRLSKSLSIRQMPFIRFKYDQKQQKEIEMLELLHKLEQERQSDATARGESAATPAPRDEA
jgi:ribosome-binding factor A